MLLDYNEIREKMQNCSECCIIATKQYAHLVKDVYDHVIDYNASCEVYILSSDDIICPLKHHRHDFSILLGTECMAHHFENAVRMRLEVETKWLDKIALYDKVIYDSIYGIQPNTEDYLADSEVLVVSKNPVVYRFWSRKYNCASVASLSSDTKLQFLSRRICTAEKCRKAKTYAIIFVHEMYKDLALRIRNALVQSEKFAYMLFLKNVHYSRLVTIENVDAIVLIDCPVFDNLDIDVSLPILTPADVAYMLTDVWDATYDANRFDVPQQLVEDNTLISKYEGAGKLLLNSDFFGIEYGASEEDYDIHEGRKGIAKGYDDE